MNMTARPVVMDSHVKKLFQDFKKGKISANLYEAEVHKYRLTGNSQHPQTLSLRVFLRKLRVFLK